MAENEQLIIELSAETVGLVKSLATAENGLQDFAKEGKTTAATLTVALSSINKEAKNTFDVNALANYNKALQEIRTTLGGVRKIGIQDTGLKNVPNESRDARIALYGLNQVVRDLPFGFIAISNNIPVAIDQFQKLVNTSGGVLGAFKNLGGALLGAGGISFAFSALTSLVTSAIQKYGDLGTAINDVFTLIDKQTLAQIKQTDAIDKSNASIVTETSKITQLISVLGNAEEPLNKRNNAYQVLAKDYPGIIGNITEENALTKEGITDIRNRSIELLKYIELRGRESALVDLIKESSRSSFKEQRELIRQITGEGKTFVNTIIDIGETWLTGTNPIYRQVRGINDLTKETKLYSQTLNDVRNNLLELDFDITGQNIKKTQEERKKIADEEKKAAAELQTQQKVNNIQLKRKLELSKENLKYIPLESQEYEKQLIIIETIKGEIEKIGKEDKRIISQIDIDVRSNIAEKIRELNLQRNIQNELDRAKTRLTGVVLNIEPELKLKTKVGNTIAEQLRADIVTKYQDGLPIPFALKLDAKKKEEAEKKLEEIRKRQQAAYAELGQFVGRFLNSGIQTFVEGLNEGKSAADSLRDSFKKIGDELKKIIIKLAVIEGIKLLANILAPGSGAKIGAGLAQALGVPDLTGLLGTRQQAVRGLNVGPGGLAIAGNVTFVQRGPDLVGVLTAANSRINRVG